MKKHMGSILWVLCFVLIGCSSTQPIKKVSESTSEFDGAVFTGQTIEHDSDSLNFEKYRVFSQGATGFVPQSAVRSNAESRADKFCKDQGKQSKILQERRSVGAQIFGNFPRSELIFVCVDQKPTATGNVGLPSSSKNNQLRELKIMLDDGLITSKDYQSEKTKILNQK